MSIVESPSRSRFGELLPTYVSGELQGADRGWVDDYVLHDPEARRELALHRDLKAGLAERFETMSPGAELAPLMARIRADACARRPSLLERCTEALRSVSGNRMQAGFALAATVILAQAVMLGVLMNRSAEPGDGDHGLGAIRSGATRGLDSAGMMRVGFKSDTPERELRLLLVRVGARIVDGPNQLGEYVIQVAPSALGEAREALAQSAWVDRVEPARRTSE
jgi:anti-sigma factor RsiW